LRAHCGGGGCLIACLEAALVSLEERLPRVSGGAQPYLANELARHRRLPARGLGDPTHFIRADEVEAAWTIVDPIEERWAAGLSPLYGYRLEAGGRRPQMSCWPKMGAGGTSRDPPSGCPEPERGDEP